MFQSAESVVAQQLSAGERIVWSGQPHSGVRLRGQDTFLIPFSLLWGGFAIFWEASVFRTNAPFFFKLWGVPFVLVGLYIIFGRFLVDARCRSQTFYGITTERIIIVSGLFSRQIKSLNLRALTDVSLTERADGSGTITFGPVPPMGLFLPTGSWPGAGRYASPSFDLIERAKDVYEIIRSTQRASPANA
jgi:hypothetical protein